MSNTLHAISEALVVEWKNPDRPMAQVYPETSGAVPLHRIETAEHTDWVRLRIALPETPRRVKGFRLFLKLLRNESGMPIKVGAVSGTHRFLEVASIPRPRPRLQTDVWYQITGALASVTFDEDFRLSVVIDLPRSAEILLSEVTLDEFEFNATETVDFPSEVEAALPLTAEAFEVQAVPELAAAAAAPAIYASDFTLEEKHQISGWALTRAEALAACIEGTGRAMSLPLVGNACIAGLVFERAGIEAALEDAFLEASVLALRTDPAASWDFARLMHSPANEMKTLVKAQFARDRQNHVVQLWAPISTAGLTVQLEQVAEILKRNKIKFQISYHIRPRIDHPLCEHWVDPRDIDSPKLVIYFERFVEFDRGFDAAFKVFYLNLDWLSGKTLAMARTHAKVVLCPTPYLLDELAEEFQNSKVMYLPWPSQIAPVLDAEPPQPAERNPIRVLYIGNDYDGTSRKHPFAVVDAVERLERDDIVIDLKFRSPLPAEVRQRLRAKACVGEVVDWSSDYSIVKKMYERADVNLIPNACEGNGLSILEAWASMTIPAVLDGHPMKDVTSEEDSFRIECTQSAMQEWAPYYETTAEHVLAFLEGLTREAVETRRAGVRAKARELIAREAELEKKLISCVMLSGIRTRGLRNRVEEAHLPSGHYPDLAPRGGDRVRDLMFSDGGQKDLMRVPRQIDVMLTTSRRPWCLERALAQLDRAMRASPFEHRLFVAVDNLDASTAMLLQRYSYAIEQVLWTGSQMGLPYSWNALNDMLWNTIRRTELRPDYVCYIQDDCELTDPETYFETMGGVAYEASPSYLGFVSGFYTDVHPGFADFEWKGHRVIATDSIDGKNFMAAPEIFASVGPLSWHFSDGMRRGNPGPKRGSHFDLWQWKESSNSLLRQNRISLILPDLCRHGAMSASESTWNNDTTAQSTQKRIEADQVYRTRSYGT